MTILVISDSRRNVEKTAALKSLRFHRLVASLSIETLRMSHHSRANSEGGKTSVWGRESARVSHIDGP